MMVASRLKMAELTSSVGAGILGAGIGILIASLARGVVLPLIGLGIALHLWGMVEKHRAERGTAQPVWSVVTLLALLDRTRWPCRLSRVTRRVAPRR
jgi:hypothetical protein